MRIGAGTLPQIAEYARNGRVVVFDTETTGCSRWDEICQIAAAEYEGGVLSRMFSAYVRPTCEMNPWAERVHGLSLDFLSEHGQGRQRVGDSQDGRIKAILKRATLVGHSDHQDYSCEATKAKYDYVSAKIESFPKNSCVHSHFALVKKIMGFIETELPSLITDNYMFDRSKPVSMQNKAGDIHVTDNKGQVSLRPLLKVDDVRAYLEERLGVQVHINDNIIQGKRNILIDALENPWRQILDYVNKVLKTVVLESLDMFIEAESKGVEGNFEDAIGGVCLEARTNFLMSFKATYLLDSDPATLHDATMSLEKCMGQEIKLLIEHEPDDSKKTWNNVAARVKEKLVGEVRPICTAEVERDIAGDITKVTYKPVLDIDGKPVVREITEEDIDEIGEAVMATIIEGA